MVVDLGFIDKLDRLLESRFFPSKVGGKPAWLNLKDIPSIEELTCPTCHSSMHFLCQLYCPINDKDTAFHRTIFVFLCTSKGCFQSNSNSNFMVYRNQLPKRNLYYPDTPPVQDENWRSDITPAKFGVQVCSSCGIRGGQECGDDCTGYACSRSAGVLPEYGLSIEPEDEFESETDSEESEGDEIFEHADSIDYSSQQAELRQIASAQGT
jgi:pre-rRNA-processing protein TSR4